MAGKRVLVTRASDGIGLAACEALAGLGAELAIVARSRSKAGRALDKITSAGGAGTAVDVSMADLASHDSVRNLAAEVLERYPRLDVLVNNAGAVYSKRQLSPDGIELTWALNHLAPFLLTTRRPERPLLREQEAGRTQPGCAGRRDGTTALGDESSPDHPRVRGSRASRGRFESRCRTRVRRVPAPGDPGWNPSNRRMERESRRPRSAR